MTKMDDLNAWRSVYSGPRRKWTAESACATDCGIEERMRRKVNDSVDEDETYGFARYSKLVQLLA